MIKRLTTTTVSAVVGCCVVAFGVFGAAASGASQRRTASAASSKAPIKLMVVGAINAPGFSIPDLATGAQVAVNQIDHQGGVDGRRLKLLTCNDQNNPNMAAQCAHKAISEHVAALVGGLSVYDVDIEALLKQAGIPWIGTADVASDYSSGNLFLTGGEGQPSFTAIGEAAVAKGCTKVAIVVSNQGPSSLYIQEITAGVKAAGGSIATSIVEPATSTDLSPLVAAVRSSGAQCIADGLGPSQIAPLITAVNAGPKLRIITASGAFPLPLVKQLGSAANGIIVTSGYLPFSSHHGVVQQLKKQVLAIEPNAPLDQFVESGYASVEIVAHAAQGLSPFNASTLRRALTKVKGFNTGVGPVITFARDSGIPHFEREFNSEMYLQVVSNGNLVGLGKPISVRKALLLEG